MKLAELGAWGSEVGSQGRNAVAHGPRTFHGSQKAWAKFPSGPCGPAGRLQRGPCVARGHLVTEEQKKHPPARRPEGLELHCPQSSHPSCVEVLLVAAWLV